MLKKSIGNMYDWVTHMHTHLGGECPHKCSYCYVGKSRFGRAPRYTGELRIIREELLVNYGAGRTIFIEHMNDMFADGIPGDWIYDILDHCRRYQDNTYIFQTKNPARVAIFESSIPDKCMIGTTIETNREKFVNSFAPNPSDRYHGIKNLRELGFDTFITVEPIVDFNIDVLSDWIIKAQPNFVNIGADSKKSRLIEPPKEKILQFIKNLQESGIVIKKKINLERII